MITGAAVVFMQRKLTVNFSDVITYSIRIFMPLKLQTNTGPFFCDRDLLMGRHIARLNENFSVPAVNTSVLKY
jgi:hypothetical protein